MLILTSMLTGKNVSDNVVSEKLKIVPGSNHYVINWVIDSLKDRSHDRSCHDFVTKECYI